MYQLNQRKKFRPEFMKNERGVRVRVRRETKIVDMSHTGRLIETIAWQ